MLYCYNKGRTSCCFINEKCKESWDAINDEMTNKAVAFMTKPQSFLTNLVENAGYDTCHRIKEYDAEQCHQDCQKLEKSNFAETCRKRGGLYKCCIRYIVYQYIYLHISIYLSIYFRRDKKFCHECRFCCTLSVCTDKEGTTFTDSELPLNISANKVLLDC